MKWIFLFLLLIGDFLVVKKNKIGFILWILGDGFFAIVEASCGNYPTAIVFALYAFVGIYGFKQWMKNDVTIRNI